MTETCFASLEKGGSFPTILLSIILQPLSLSGRLRDALMPEKYNMALRGSCQTQFPPFLPQLPVYSCPVSLPALEIWFHKGLRSKPHLWDHFCLQFSKTEKIKPCPCFLSSAKLEKPPHFKPQASSVPRLRVSPWLLQRPSEQLISRLALCLLRRRPQ